MFVCRLLGLQMDKVSVWVHRQAPDPDSLVIEDHHCTRIKVSSDFVNIQENQRRDFRCTPMVLPAEKQDRWSGRVAYRPEFSEIGVSGHDDTVLRKRHGHDLVVRRGLKATIPRMHSVVSCVSEQHRQLRWLVLIEQEPQAGRRSGSSRS